MGLDMYMNCYTRHNPEALRLLKDDYIRQEMVPYFENKELEETELKLRIVTVRDPYVENKHDPLTDIYQADYIQALFSQTDKSSDYLEPLENDYQKALSFFNQDVSVSEEVRNELESLKQKYPDKETFQKSGEPVENKDFEFYWRKANHIHAYFVNNVQDGVDDQEAYEVTEETLLDLKSKLETAISLYESTELSESDKKESLSDTLPCQSGFFFGGNSYDQYYHSDNKDTLDYVNRVLNEMDFEKHMLFYSSWW